MLACPIKIQSISDIITNSSSEVFCRIESENSLELIKEILEPLFPYSRYSDSEDGPSLAERILSEEKSEYDNGYLDGFPEKWLEITLPYSMCDSGAFYEAGLEAILSNRVPDDYTIIYGEY